MSEEMKDILPVCALGASIFICLGVFGFFAARVAETERLECKASYPKCGVSR